MSAPAFPSALSLILLIMVPFSLHYLSIRDLMTSRVRLERSRFVYIGLSFQLLLIAWWSPAIPALFAAGMTFSFLGDFFNLQFPAAAKKMPEPVFAGVLCFIPAQCIYTAAFWSVLPPGLLFREGFYLPLLVLVPLGGALIFRFRVWKPGRPRFLLRSAFIYTFFLGAMAATALSSALAAGGAWWFIAAGAGFFLLSDSVMGETTIAGRHPVWEFQVPWGTYLLAQALILGGAAAAVAAA